MVFYDSIYSFYCRKKPLSSNAQRWTSFTAPAAFGRTKKNRWNHTDLGTEQNATKRTGRHRVDRCSLGCVTDDVDVAVAGVGSNTGNDLPPVRVRIGESNKHGDFISTTRTLFFCVLFPQRTSEDTETRRVRLLNGDIKSVGLQSWLYVCGDCYGVSPTKYASQSGIPHTTRGDSAENVVTATVTGVRRCAILLEPNTFKLFRKSCGFDFDDDERSVFWESSNKLPQNKTKHACMQMPSFHSIQFNSRRKFDSFDIAVYVFLLLLVPALGNEWNFCLAFLGREGGIFGIEIAL